MKRMQLPGGAVSGAVSSVWRALHRTQRRRQGASPSTDRSTASRRRLWRASAGIAAVCVVAGVSATSIAYASGPPPPPPHPLYVSPSGTSRHADTSCATAGYTSIQTAVNAVPSGDTVYVCAGTYYQQVVVSKPNVTLTGAGTTQTVLDPSTTSPVLGTDLDTAKPLVAVVDVDPGVSGVTVSNFKIDGNGLRGTYMEDFGCGDPDFAGVAFQDASGTAVDLDVTTFELTPVTLFYCASNPAVGLLVQSGPRGSARVTMSQSTITTYKNGIFCEDAGTTCDISHNTITGGPAPTTGEGYNGVVVLTGASATISHNTISDNYYKPRVFTSPEPQATWATGLELLGAKSVEVTNNTFTNDQIAVNLVHTNGTVKNNGITDSTFLGGIGVFAVPCTIYCTTLGVAPGGTQQVTVEDNTISLGAPDTGTGIWAGDPTATRTGSVVVDLQGNTVFGAYNNVVLGPTASGTVSAPR